MTNLLLLLLLIVLLYIICSRQLEYYMSPKDPFLDELKRQLETLHPKLEDVEMYQGKKTYTINKSKVYICLKDSDGKYYDRNMLVYAICHEYAHVLCDEVGHTKKFLEIFERLLEKAAQKGFYDPSIPPLKEYCGHT